MKRLFDFVVALSALLLLLPIILVVALSIRVKLGKPVFFIQERPGRNCNVFKLIKFRTMKDVRNLDGSLASDEVRVTRFGALLRSSSLDELPSLVNVLRGEMSLVGPRPLLIQYLSLYNKEQIRRHDVRPGITGWAQINGRNAISWEERFKLDVWYVDNRTFWVDLKILFLTIKKVLAREGISAAGRATMSKFRGDNQ